MWIEILKKEVANKGPKDCCEGAGCFEGNGGSGLSG